MDPQPSTSTSDLQATMAQIESVCEARMDAHTADKLAEHDSAITKIFVDQDKKSESQFHVLETLLGTKFDNLETTLKTKVDSQESYLTIKLDAIESAMIVKVDAVETKLTNMVNPTLSDLDSDFGQ